MMSNEYNVVCEIEYSRTNSVGTYVRTYIWHWLCIPSTPQFNRTVHDESDVFLNQEVYFK